MSFASQAKEVKNNAKINEETIPESVFEQKFLDEKHKTKTLLNAFNRLVEKQKLIEKNYKILWSLCNKNSDDINYNNDNFFNSNDIEDLDPKVVFQENQLEKKIQNDNNNFNFSTLNTRDENNVVNELYLKENIELKAELLRKDNQLLNNEIKFDWLNANILEREASIKQQEGEISKLNSQIEQLKNSFESETSQLQYFMLKNSELEESLEKQNELILNKNREIHDIKLTNSRNEEQYKGQIKRVENQLTAKDSEIEILKENFFQKEKELRNLEEDNKRKDNQIMLFNENISVGVVFDYADTLSALVLTYTGSETVVDNVETCPHSQQRSLTRTVFIILKDRKILKETKQ